MSGFWKGDAIASGLELAGAGIRAQAAAQAHLDDVDRLVAQRKEVENHHAANLAEKHALRAALARFDPKHPLLVNKSLQEKVKAAGVRALQATYDWNAAREAGDKFKI